jgi:alkylation response protein AidB-like acyl-CoA dehydrogenase
MIIAGDVLKKAAKNHLPIFKLAKGLLEELMGFPDLDMDEDESFLAAEKELVAKAKKAALLGIGTVAQEMGEKLKAPMEHEEVLGLIADTITDIYAMESSVFRTLKLKDRGDEQKTSLAADMTKLYCNDAIHRIEFRTRDLLAAICSGDTLTTLMAGLRRIAKHTPVNTVALRRNVADALIAEERWPF